MKESTREVFEDTTIRAPLRARICAGQQSEQSAKYKIAAKQNMQTDTSYARVARRMHTLPNFSHRNGAHSHRTRCTYIDRRAAAAAASATAVATATAAASAVANRAVCHLEQTPNASQNGWWNEFIDAANR